ncbi:MAG: hypothetical protein PHF00_01255, partial [Elusimicrobia bacterium]|nr:hypothetical protein [Elusimicrobiota bacterium]
MDTNQSAPEIPNFKLARVGETKRRRRKAGAPFGWGSPKPVNPLAGIGGAGGGGAAGVFSALGAKIVVAVLVGTLGVGAYSVGRVLAPDAGKFEAPKKLFARHAKPKYGGDLSKLPGVRSYQSGLALVSGSLDGLTPEERAARIKEQEAKAAAEAQAKAEAEAAKEPEGQAGAPVDATALAAAAGAAAGKEAQKGLGHKFGTLSSSFGGGSGGLAGGSGLAGGVGRGFDSAKLKGDGGRLSLFSANKGGLKRGQARAVNVGRSGKGLARRQLDGAHALSKAARSTNGEAGATLASQAFDGAAAGGNGITGAGAGDPAGGAAAGGTGAGNAPNPVGGGSYGGSSGGGEAQDCAAFGDGYVLSDDGTCVKSESGHSVDPTDPYFKILTILA